MGREGMSRRHALYKMVAMVLGTNVVRKSSGPGGRLPRGRRALFAGAAHEGRCGVAAIASRLTANAARSLSPHVGDIAPFRRNQHSFAPIYLHHRQNAGLANPMECSMG